MATQRMDVTSFVGKLLEQDDVDALREGVRVLAQLVMEAEVSAQIGARPMNAAGTGTGPAPGIPESAPSNSRSPRSPRACTSPRSSSLAGARRRPCTPWWWRPT